MSSERDMLYADCARSLARSGTARLEPLRNTTILITGGSGFVGSWLSVFAAFLNDRHNFGIGIVATARRPPQIAEPTGFLHGRADYRFVAADIRQFIDLPGNVAWLVHAAGVPDSRHHATNPMETMSVIAAGTDRILRIAETAVNLRAILHFSSALVYGARSSPAALREDDLGVLDPLNLSNSYAEAKRYAETLCAAFRSQGRLPIVITRPFTFMGPFQPLDAPWAANNFLFAAMQGQPLKVLGSGNSERSYLYGSDLALLALHQLIGGKTGTAYNLGHPDPISLRDLAELVARQSGRALEIRYNTAGRDIGTSQLLPNMQKSVVEFGFVPAFTAAEAVSHTLRWYANQRAKVLA